MINFNKNNFLSFLYNFSMIFSKTLKIIYKIKKKPNTVLRKSLLLDK